MSQMKQIAAFRDQQILCITSIERGIVGWERVAGNYLPCSCLTLGKVQ